MSEYVYDKTSYANMSVMEKELYNWPLFSLLEPHFLSTVQIACVFGNAGNEALLVTKDDDVYAIGTNCSGCLGLGDSYGSLTPQKVEVLSQKRITDLSYGTGPHVLAITSDGELFVWGHNGYCQLGNGSTNQGLIPSLCTTNLNGKVISQVACGCHHSLALTSEGEVFSWGQNNCGQVGSGTTTNQPTPRKITACIGTKLVTSVSCGTTSSTCVLDSGDVFSWGFNGNGQLGLGNNVNQANPCRVAALQAIFIVQVVCGYTHTMALSDEGSLFSWGGNAHGQLGTGNKANQCVPAKVNTVLHCSANIRFVEIAAVHYNQTSAAITQTGTVYMWGQCRGLSLASPTRTRLQTLQDVFAMFASPAVTWKTMKIEHVDACTITESLWTSFNDPATSDIKFEIEGQVLHVHKSILKIRCEHFRSMFQSHWGEDGKDVIEISLFPYIVYRAFLEFLYCDKVHLPPEDAIDLLDLANSYCELNLKRLCARIIKQGITVENAAMLYAAAIKYEAQDLEDFCFRFALNHMTAVTQTESFANLDNFVVKTFIQRAAKNGAFKN